MTYAEHVAAWREGWRRANARHVGLRRGEYALGRLPERLRAGALHEAAHALATMLLRGHFDEVRLDRHGVGSCDYPDRLARQSQLAVLVAGRVAAVLFEEVADGADDDLRRAIVLADSKQDQLDAAVDLIAPLLHHERRALHALAVALISAGRLGFDDARRIARLAGARVA